MCVLPPAMSVESSPGSGLSSLVRTILEQQLHGPETGFAPSAPGPVLASPDLARFYAERGYAPAWIDDRLDLDGAAALIQALRETAGDGLNPREYRVDALEGLISALRGGREEGPAGPRLAPVGAAADLEMMLTDAFLRCGGHLLRGRLDPESVWPGWTIAGREDDVPAVLEQGLADRDVSAALNSLRPAHPVYRGLTRALRDYRAILDAGGLPSFPAGPKLERGLEDERVPRLRECLAASGDFTPAPEDPPLLFDDRLEAAVRAFQRRHGLDDDGIVFTRTVAALNVPAEARLLQILANLERWRWVSADLGRRHVLANIPGFMIYAVEDGREVLALRSMVGKAFLRTRLFSSRFISFTINPFWFVPPGVARRDILPQIQQDPDYLQRNRMRVYSDGEGGLRAVDPAGVDWTAVDPRAIPFLLHMDPGPANPMGRFKFVLPNDYTIYFHDTPDRHLFEQAVRTFSAGCIRVDQPLELALFLLGGDPAAGRADLEALLTTRRSRTFVLGEPVPVHLIYWTAWLDGNGRVQFRDDIYRRDEALLGAMRGLMAGELDHGR